MLCRLLYYLIITPSQTDILTRLFDRENNYVKSS